MRVVLNLVLAAAHPSATRLTPPASSTNPDDLLNAVASVSGTIAAILGGFVLAALINLASERASLAQLNREQQRAVHEAESRHQALLRGSDAAFRKSLRRWMRAAYGRREVLPGAAEILSRLTSLEIAQNEPVQEQVEQFREDWAAANACLTADYDRLLRHPPSRSWAKWLAETPRKGVDPELLRDAFDRVVESIERKEALGSASSVSPLAPSTPGSEVDPLLAAELALRQWPEGPEVSGVARAEEEVEHARRRFSESQQELMSRRLPPYLLYGVGLFIFMMGAGVVYPLLLMPAKPTDLSNSVSFFVKGTVVAQAVAIVLYMGLLVRAIRARNERAAGLNQ